MIRTPGSYLRCTGTFLLPRNSGVRTACHNFSLSSFPTLMAGFNFLGSFPVAVRFLWCTNRFLRAYSSAEKDSRGSTGRRGIQSWCKHCPREISQDEMAPGWKRTMGNKNAVYFHWLLDMFLQACKQNSFPLSFLHTGLFCIWVAWLENLSGPVVPVSPHLAAEAHLKIRQHCRKPLRQAPQTVLQVSQWLIAQSIQLGQGSPTVPWGPVWFVFLLTAPAVHLHTPALTIPGNFVWEGRGPVLQCLSLP